MMIKNFSFFKPPVMTTVPAAVCQLEAVHSFIKSNEKLARLTNDLRECLTRNESEYRAMKSRVLPFVTPAGVFRFRREECLEHLSGDFVIDVDHLDSERQAEELRDQLFADTELQADLAFKSPSGKGFKLFVPYKVNIYESPKNTFDRVVRNAWIYIKVRYGLDCDTQNIDMSRACFLCHDDGAKIRLNINK